MAAPVRGRGDARPPCACRSSRRSATSLVFSRPCLAPQSGRLGPGISSNRAMLQVAAKSSSAIRGNAWHRNPGGHDVRSLAAQPSGLRGQALPRPRFKVVAMAAPVRGQGDARPLAAASLKACWPRSGERTTGAWHLLESRHASRRSDNAVRDSRQCLAPQPGGHDVGRIRTHPAQPSGLRCQALPRPRFKVVAMAAPVRGRGDARPPFARQSEGHANHRSR
jgi:hypothetical protein